MIERPRRNVTRFFIPMLDVMILLFSMFLLLPIAQRATQAETAVEEMSLPELVAKAQKSDEELEKLQKQNKELKLRVKAWERIAQLSTEQQQTLRRALNAKLPELMKKAENRFLFLKDGKIPYMKIREGRGEQLLLFDFYSNEPKANANLRKLEREAKKRRKTLNLILLHTTQHSGTPKAFDETLRWFEKKEVPVSYLEYRN